MSKKLFITSDIHGFYTELMAALDEAGFDAENEDHYFVSGGDLFDRGTENAQVYGFVKGLERRILIKGNHEQMLCEALDCGISTSREHDNGAENTIRELLGPDAIGDGGRIDVDRYAEKIKEIKAFVASMSDYLEVDDYVIVHGWLPVLFEGRWPTVDPQWREASDEAWDFARELGWHELYGVGATLAGKTIVCGHRPSRLGSMYDSLRDPNFSEPFYGDGMIAIDAGTVRSGRVNVIVIETSEL